MKLVYDVSVCPNGLGIANLVKIFEQHRVVFWDSTLGGVKPRFTADDNSDLPVTLVDLEGKELDIERYTREFADDEFWAKELHYCKNSPIYHFSNYLTPVFPATDEGIKEHLLSLGIENIVDEDSTTAQEKWEAQKNKIAEASANITIESLKEAKGVMEVLKAAHEKHISILTEVLRTKVSLFDGNGHALPDKTRMSNLIYKIRKSLPVAEKYADKYKNIAGKWDASMLYSTKYDTLLEIAHHVIKE